MSLLNQRLTLLLHATRDRLMWRRVCCCMARQERARPCWHVPWRIIPTAPSSECRARSSFRSTSARVVVWSASSLLWHGKHADHQLPCRIPSYTDSWHGLTSWMCRTCQAISRREQVSFRVLLAPSYTHNTLFGIRGYSRIPSMGYGSFPDQPFVSGTMCLYELPACS